MDEHIFSGNGVEIVRRDGSYFIRYDAGGLAVQMREDEITEQQARRAMLSEKDAYRVLLEVQRSQQANKATS